MNAPQMQKLPDGRRAMLAFQSLLAANRDLAEAVTRVADEILAAEGVTPGERSLLLLVRRHRALTVPRLAEHKGVSRQHVRVAVGKLAKKGLLALRPNPAHKRSRLVTLTPAGVDLVKRIMAREGAVMARVASRLDPGRTKAAAAVLGEVLGQVREK
jgi:DNA-binding MarR family transcriptional regulator